MRSLVGVVYVEEETRVSGMQEHAQWHVDRVDQPRLPLDGRYQPSVYGRDVDVYVMDSGINYGHEEFEGRAKYSGYDPMDVHLRESRRGQDCHGHGTHVASVVAGRTSGVARAARVYSVRVLDCSNVGVWSVVVSGLQHISSMVNLRGRPALVVTAFIGPTSRAVNNAIQQLYSQGILTVSSAGNYFMDACRYTPSGSAETLTAGGTTRMDTLYPLSNYGACVDVLAPASDVRGADTACSSCYRLTNGTSSSAALAVGVAAMILSQEPRLKPPDLKSRMTSTAIRNILQLPNSVRSFTTNALLQIPGKV